jgi:glutathione S-transferase
MWSYNDALDAPYCSEDFPRLGLINPILNWLPEKEAESTFTRYLSCLPKTYSHLEEDLRRNEGPFFGGDRPHYGEFVVFHCIDCIRILDGGDSLRTRSEELQAWVKAFEEIPAVKEYLESRPKPGCSVGIGRAGSIIASHTVPAERGSGR